MEKIIMRCIRYFQSFPFFSTCKLPSPFQFCYLKRGRKRKIKLQMKYLPSYRSGILGMYIVSYLYYIKLFSICAVLPSVTSVDP